MSDAPSDELARALDALAREDAAGLLDEARELARERVRARLVDELERRLLEHAARPADTAAPPRPEPPTGVGAAATGASAAARADASAASEEARGHGVYVYAVVDGGADCTLPPELRGVGGAPVRVVTDGRLQALVSDVPLDEFGDEALRRNLNELSWLTDTAVAHEAVVDAALAAATVVPMRLCTIFRDDAAARDMLGRERAGLEEALDRLRGSKEWGVKVVADPDAVADAVAQRSERMRELRESVASAGEGAGYLAARRLEQATRDEVDAELERRTREIHDALAAVATDVRVNPPSNRELAGYEGDMVLNAAFLVAEARTEEFRGTVASQAERHGQHGLRVELTGPWPPYNFSMMAGGL